MAVMVGELCTDISNRLGNFIEAFGIMDSEAKSAAIEARRRKRRRTDEGDDAGEEDQDSDPEDVNDDDDDEEGDNNDDEGGNNDDEGGNTDDEVDEQQQGDEPVPDFQITPRRSPSLTPPKSHDGPASNLRKRSTGVESPVDDPDFMSVEGLTMSTREKQGMNILIGCKHVKEMDMRHRQFWSGVHFQRSES
jgi:hypothetical protein